MVSLQTVGRRFESELYTASGFPFPGVILPLDEGSIISYDFTEPRLILRVRHDCPVQSGTILMDPADRKYIMADQDTGIAYDVVLYRTHRLFRVNKIVRWEREAAGTIDPLTGLARSTGRTLMGNIDVMIESAGREDQDSQMRVKEERFRVVTASPVQLGDIIDNMVVRQISNPLGIWLAEIE